MAIILWFCNENVLLSYCAARDMHFSALVNDAIETSLHFK